MVIPKNKHHSNSSERARRRTQRACDRCQLKKAKCDGINPCKTCEASRSECMYTTKRAREARSEYCKTREVMDKALQRMYWACRNHSGFPGKPVNESNGIPSTTAILEALGLVTPSPEELEGGENASKHVNTHGNSSFRPTEPTTSTTCPSSTTSPAPDEYIPSPAQSSSSTASVHSPKSEPTITTTQTTSTIPATPPEMDMSEQFLCAASEYSSSNSNSTSECVVYHQMDNSSNMTFDLDTFLDTSSCTMPPIRLQPAHNLHGIMQYDIPAMMERPGAAYPRESLPQPAIPFVDPYLAPWPGSLAAVYNTDGRNVPLTTC